MHPQKHELLRRFELIWLRHEQPLEHVAEVPDVKLVVEVCCCLPEIRSNLCKQNNVRGMKCVMIRPSRQMALGLRQQAFQRKTARVPC